MPAIRVVMSPVNDAALVVRFVFAVKLHVVTHLEPGDARCEVDVVGNEQCPTGTDFNYEALMPTAVIVVRQYPRNDAAALGLSTATRGDEVGGGGAGAVVAGSGEVIGSFITCGDPEASFGC